jgi:hypothetical protein
MRGHGLGTQRHVRVRDLVEFPARAMPAFSEMAHPPPSPNGFLDAMFWVGQPLDQGTIIRKQQQTLAIPFQATCSINVWHIDVVSQRGMARPFIGKL